MLVDSRFSKWQLPFQITDEKPQTVPKFQTNWHSLVTDVNSMTPEWNLILTSVNA
jgi:hypothetical protein